jgi:hypothetical protein
MKQISSFLEKFSRLIKDNKDLKKEILLAVKSAANISLDEKNISIKNGTLYIKEKPQVKNEIFMKKEKILSSIEQILGKKAISDIR